MPLTPRLPVRADRNGTDVSRRTIIQGAAWSIPVVAAAGAVPLAAATGASIIFLQSLGTIAVCSETNTTGIVQVGSDAAPGANALVTVTLPAGLAWADGTASSSKVFTADASGRVSLVGLITGTGVVGNHAVTATAPGFGTATSVLSTKAQKSAIWYSGNAAQVYPADTDGVVVSPVELAVTAGYAYARDAQGGWYAHSGAVDGDWREIPAPAVDKIFAGEGGSGWGYALSGGEVYRAHPNATVTHLSGISGVTEFAQTGNRLFAVDSTGNVQQALFAGASPWQQIVVNGTTDPLTDIVDLTGNEGGGYGWAISGTDIYYMLDNGRAYLSTTTATKPAAPKALAIGSGWAYALDDDGSVWSRAGATSGDWNKMTGLPGPATRISENEGGDFVWALVNGKLYSGWGTGLGGGAFVDTGSLPDLIVDFAIGAGWAYAQLADGTVWSHAGAGAGTWNKMTYNAGDGGGDFHPTFLTTNYGNYSWFIADNTQTCVV